MIRNPAIALATAILSSGLAASASPSPLRDFIDVCTHPAVSLSEITHEFALRGWLRLEEQYPNWAPNLLADGHLLWFLDTHAGNEQLNFLGVDVETAELPDVTGQMQSMVTAIEEGKAGILLAEEQSNAVIFAYFRDPSEHSPGTTCYMYGDDIAEMDALFDAFDQTIHNHLIRETGPTKVYSHSFRGDPPPKRPVGIHRLAISIGLLPAKPIYDPPIGAGVSKVWLHTYDEAAFRERYNRLPHATYFISADTLPSNEVPQ